MASTATKLIKSCGVVLMVGVGILVYNYLTYAIFWQPTEEVAFESAPGITIRGTLVKPSDEGAFPVAVILHGSGPESRKEISYRVMANAIVRSGVAVLFYDKRGVGESGGDYESTNFSDLVADAVAAVEYLAERQDIDRAHIALLGNSQSGWLTPEIAIRSGQVSYIVNRAGPPLSWMDNVIWEVRNDLLADGVPQSELEPFLGNARRRWEYYVDAAADPSLASGPRRDSINAEIKALTEKVPAAINQIGEELVPYDADVYHDLATDRGYDPRSYLEMIDIPLLYMFAEHDINVPTTQSVDFLESIRNETGTDVEIIIFDGVGHAMAGWTGIFTAGYIPEFVDILGTRFAEQAAR